MELLGQISCFLCSQRVEGTASGERTTSIDPQAPGKKSDYRSPRELRESKTKLLDQMRHVLRLKHMSIRTEKAYVQWAKRFILFHHKRHPADMGAPDIHAFLTHLAVEVQVAASTHNVAQIGKTKHIFSMGR